LERKPTLKQIDENTFVVDIPESFPVLKKEFYGGIRGKRRGWKLTITRP